MRPLRQQSVREEPASGIDNFHQVEHTDIPIPQTNRESNHKDTFKKKLSTNVIKARGSEDFTLTIEIIFVK